MAEEDFRMLNRQMGDLSISKSFKGILRLAHIKDIQLDSPDVFLNPEYYGEPSELISIAGDASSGEEKGYLRAAIAFDGGIERYTSNDPFKNCIVPVTDSVGNYLNWNAGEVLFTIGSDENINGHSVDKVFFNYKNELGGSVEKEQNKIFPVLTANHILIGMEGKLLKTEKEIVSKDSQLIILNGNNEDIKGELIVENYYDHSNLKKKEYSETETTYKPLEDLHGNKYYFYEYQRPIKNGVQDTETQFRTIYRDTKDKIEEYDSFIYHQDDYDYHNYHERTEGGVKVAELLKNVDAVVGIENIVDYVKKKVELFTNSRTVEVPTGTVIWQHVSLDKWYNLSISGTLNKISMCAYPGNNPPMESTSENNQLGINNIQGATRGNNHLLVLASNVSGDGAFYTIQSPEVIPLYKRDYILCDGSSYSIYCYRKSPDKIDSLIHYASNVNDLLLYESYDRFINLFFALGYWYTGYNYNSTESIPFFLLNARYGKSYIEVTDLSEPEAPSEIRQEYNMDNRYSNARSRINVGIGNLDEFKKENFDSLCPASHKKWTHELDRYVLFGADLIKLLTYRLISSQRSNLNEELYKNGNYSASKARKWIKELLTDDKFIFNTFIGWSNNDIKSLVKKCVRKESTIRYCSNGAKEVIAKLAGKSSFDLVSVADIDNIKFVIDYDYHNTSLESGKSVKLCLGREVNSYNSLILTYNYDNDYKKWHYTICCVYEMAEVNDILDSFEYITIASIEKDYFKKYNKVEFRVPSLADSQGGLFIGSHMYTWRDEADKFQKTVSWSPLVGSELPHRHTIYKGHLNPYDESIGKEAERPEMITNNTRPAADASYKGTYSSPGAEASKTWKNYVIAEVDGTNGEDGNIEWSFKFDSSTMYSFMDVYEMLSNNPYFHTNSYSDDPRLNNAEPQRAATSPPDKCYHFQNDCSYYWNSLLYKDINYTTKNYTTGTSTGWGEEGGRAELFVPRSITMLPLIKL